MRRVHTGGIWGAGLWGTGLRGAGVWGAVLAAAALLLAGCDSRSGPYSFEADRGSDRPSTPVITEATPPPTAEPTRCPTESPMVAAAIATAAPEDSGVLLATSPNCDGFRWLLLSTAATGPNAAPTAPQAPRHVLLFRDDSYLGPAASIPSPYTEVIGQTPDTIVVRYRWARLGDAPDRPTGGPVDVRYQQSAAGVVALDPVPTAPTDTAAEAAGCSNPVGPEAVAAAIALLPPTPSGAWQPGPTITGCQELGWAVVTAPASVGAPTASHVLFFARGRYVGTATNDPLIDAVVEGNPTSDTVEVTIGPADPNGPATARYQWDGVRLLTLGTVGG